MIIGVLQLELRIAHAASLKDKRRVVRSLKDRLHRHHQVSVAETGTHDVIQTATLGLVLAAAEVAYCQSARDRIFDEVKGSPEYELTNHRIEVIRGS